MGEGTADRCFALRPLVVKAIEAGGSGAVGRARWGGHCDCAGSAALGPNCRSGSRFFRRRLRSGGLDAAQNSKKHNPGLQIVANHRGADVELEAAKSSNSCR
jgi:hypothetical protein